MLLVWSPHFDSLFIYLELKNLLLLYISEQVSVGSPQSYLTDVRPQFSGAARPRSFLVKNITNSKQNLIYSSCLSRTIFDY